MVKEADRQSPMNNRVSRRKFLTLAGQSSLGLLLAACAGAAPTATPTRAPTATPIPTPTPKPVKDTFTIVQATLANNMEPHDSGGTFNLQVFRNIYEPPLHDNFLEGEFGWVNRLATNVSVDADGHYVLKLREGVKFHGGEPFTADDVKFSVERLQDPATKALRAGLFQRIARVEVPDPYTARLVLKEPPQPAIYNNLRYLYIVSRSWMQGKTLADTARSTNGTGPYKMTRFVPEQVVEMEANENWWGGKVPFKKAIFRFASEEATRLALLQRREADIVGGLPPEYIQIAESAGMKVVVANTQGPAYLALGNLDEKNPIDPTQPNPMRDLRVRQALNYAINREVIMKSILRGTPFPIRSPIPDPTMRGHVPASELTQWDYNPDKAKQLLKEAGYEKGFKNRLTLQATGWIKGVDVAEAIAQNLKEYGIETAVNPIPQPLWVGVLSNSKTQPMHLEMGWGPALDPWQLTDLMTGRFKWFQDAELTQAIKDTYKLSLPDQDAALRRLTKLTWEKVPVVWLWMMPIIWAHSPDIVWPKFGEKNQTDLYKVRPAG